MGWFFLFFFNKSVYFNYDGKILFNKSTAYNGRRVAAAALPKLPSGRDARHLPHPRR